MIKDYIEDFEELLPPGKLFRIILDLKYMKWKIVSSDAYELAQLREAFSTENPTKFFSSQYGYNAPDKLYIINMFGYFDFGLLEEVLKYIKVRFGSVECVEISQPAKKFINDYLLPLKKFTQTLDYNDFQLPTISDKFKLREYQAAAIKSIIFKGYGRGLIELPTGSGKSLVIATYINFIHKYINPDYVALIYVPTRQLVDQFYTDLLEYGIDKNKIARLAGGIGKKTFNPINTANILISNRQYISFEKLRELNINIGCLVVDEVHTVSPNSSCREFISNLDCPLRIGLSGTIPKEKYNKLMLIGVFGKIFFNEEVIKLQNSGYLTSLEITTIKVKDNDVENDKNCLFNINSNKKFNNSNYLSSPLDDLASEDIFFNSAFNAEIEYINKHTTKLYTPILNTLKEKLDSSTNTLILFERIDTGKQLFDLAKKIWSSPDDSDTTTSPILYIDGQVDVEIREKIRKTFENSNGKILFAQVSIFSTGINIKNLSNLVLFASSKSPNRIIQSIGRILRKHENKNMSHLFDVVFNFKYSNKHYRIRKKLYKEIYHKSKVDNTIKIDVG